MSEKKLTGYDLSRRWFDFCFENPELINVNHHAIYFFAIEHCNRLGWKNKFGFPTQMAMDAIGIKKHGTYIKYFLDLVEWGFIILVQRSMNQYSANIISLASAMPEMGKALDKAIVKHTAKQTESMGQSTGESNSSIDKLITINQEPITNTAVAVKFIFRDSLIDFGFDERLVNDWMIVRSKKKCANTETAFNGFITQVKKSQRPINEVLRICVERSWGGFDAKWLEKEININNGKKQISNSPTESVNNDWGKSHRAS